MSNKILDDMRDCDKAAALFNSYRVKLLPMENGGGKCETSIL
jgi:hypothetical protein